MYTVTGTPAPAHLGSWPEFQNVCPERSGFLSPPSTAVTPGAPLPTPGLPPFLSSWSTSSPSSHLSVSESAPSIFVKGNWWEENRLALLKGRVRNEV